MSNEVLCFSHSTPLKRGTGCLLAGLLSAILSVAIAQTSEPPTSQSVELAPAIRDEVMKVVSKSEPPALLRVVRGEIESGSTKPKAERYFERLENGLWGVTLLIPVRGVIVRRMLTLNGIIDLATATQIAREIDVPSLVPVGKYFLSFSITKDLKTSGITNTTALSGDLGTLVSPTAGAKFSFEHAWDAQATTTTTGLFGGTRTSNISIALKQICTVEKEAEATELHSKLKGKYLLVACNGEFQNGKSVSKQFAFVRDSGLYLLLSSTIDGNKDTYTITDVEYAK